MSIHPLKSERANTHKGEEYILPPIPLILQPQIPWCLAAQLGQKLVQLCAIYKQLKTAGSVSPTEIFIRETGRIFHLKSY